MDKETQKVILTDKFGLRIIELPKIKEEEQEELIDWLLFLENPQSERIKKKMEENEELKEAEKSLHYIKLKTFSYELKLQSYHKRF